MTAFRIFLAASTSGSATLVWFTFLSSRQLAAEYSPDVLARIHFQQPGIAAPMLMTLIAIWFWRRAFVYARKHEEDPL